MPRRHNGSQELHVPSTAKPGLIHLPPPSKPLQPTKPTVNYWRSRLLVPHMYQEMITNAKSPEVAELKEMTSGERARQTFPMSGEPGEGAARGGMVLSDYYLAGKKWAELVASGHRWDHKPIIYRMLSLRRPDPKTGDSGDMHFPIEGDPDHEYYYDIWSNIHFGYVGRAAGFTGWILQ
jgi:hypothetical protein